jgi:shikimate kinase
MPSEAKNAKTAKLQLTRPVVLVGLMGAGKTTIGRRLAAAISLPFVDSDHEIVEAAGCSISDIFEIYGEEVFRDLEKRVMLRLLSAGPAVIATGGGAYINPVIRDAIREKARSVWLKADLEILIERVSRRDSRPLLKTGDKKAIMGKLMEDRYPVYAEADIVIDSNTGTHESVVEAIIAALLGQSGQSCSGQSCNG